MSSNDHVCPRCGNPANDDVWCEACGLNLRQQTELPSKKAFDAGRREKEWLERQETERANEKTAKADEGREAKKNARQEAAGKRRTKLRRSAPWVLVVLLTVGFAGLAWTLTEADLPAIGTSPLAETNESDGESDSNGINAVEGEAPPGDAPTGTTQCPPVAGAGPSSPGPTDAVGIEATGTDCATAVEVADGLYPLPADVGPGEAIPVAGFECIPPGTGSAPAQCTGPESASVEWFIGDADIAPEGFTYCSIFGDARSLGVFSAGSKGVSCTEAESFLGQSVGSEEPAPWTCELVADEPSGGTYFCSKGNTGGEVRYFQSTTF